MKKNEKRCLLLGSVFLAMFVLWTALIQMVDVQSVGQNETSIGFATFNCWFHHLIGVNKVIYTITDWMGLVPIVVCLVFAGVGLIQLIKRRSIFKVDADIMILGVYFAVVILAYVIFEIIPINYRPILIEGRMEASYPSSTTLLVLSVQMREPFSKITVRSVRKIGIVLIYIASSKQLVLFLLPHIWGGVSPGIDLINQPGTVNCITLGLLGFLFLFLSRVFGYGCELQEESDTTI